MTPPACDNTEPARLLAISEEKGFNKTLDANVASLGDDCFVFMIFILFGH